MVDDNEVVEAIRDLTRVILALHGDFPTTSDAIRKLLSLSIPATRVADLLGLPPNHVHAVTAQDRKRAEGRSPKNGKKGSRKPR